MNVNVNVNGSSVRSLHRKEEGAPQTAPRALAREVGAADICRTLSSRRISVQMDDAGAVDNNGFLDDVADGGDHVSFPALGTAESMLQDAIAIDCEMVKTHKTRRSHASAPSRGTRRCSWMSMWRRVHQ